MSKKYDVILVTGILTIVVIASIVFFQIHPPYRTVNLEDSKLIVEQSLPQLVGDFRIKEVIEFSNNFYVVVQEIDTGVNAFELHVDPYSGKILHDVGPNILWNQKYMHSGLTGEYSVMPLTPVDALVHAERWLGTYLPGTSIEELKTFYGYYTIDVLKDGELFGMLSVNGYSGDVWYHNWHGRFIQMEQYA